MKTQLVNKYLNFFKNSLGQGIIEIIVVLALAAILILALVALGVRSNRSTTFSKTSDQAARLSQEGIEIVKDIRKVGAGAVTGFCITGATSISPTAQSAAACGANTWVDGATVQKTWSELYNYNLQDEQEADVDHTFHDIFGSYSGYGWQTHLHYYDGTSTAGTAINDPAQGNYGGGNIQPKVTAPDGGCGVTVSWCVDLQRDVGGVELNGRIFRRFIYLADTPAIMGGHSHCNSTATDWHEIKQVTSLVTWADSSGEHQKASTICLTP